MSDPVVMLSWDTCTERGVVAVSRGGAILASSRFETVKGHAGWLMPLIDSAMRSAGIEPSGLDAIAVGTGPGGYTGVKVGVSTAKALALALDIPLLGVGTLDLLAGHAPPEAGPVLACMDARQGLVYAAGYMMAGDVPDRVTGYECLRPEEAARLAARLGSPSVAAIGHVPDETVAAAKGLGVEISVIDARARAFPSAEILVALARGILARGGEGDAFSVVPVYLKPPV